MKIMNSFIAPMILVWIFPTPFSARPIQNKILDLSYPFKRDTIYWPTELRFRHQLTHKGLTEKGFYYESYNFAASEHGGTHMDAPSHFCDPDSKGNLRVMEPWGLT